MDCVRDFTSRSLSDKEVNFITNCTASSKETLLDYRNQTCLRFQETCAGNCLDKYLKMTQRISLRFQEFQVNQNEAAMAAASSGILHPH